MSSVFASVSLNTRCRIQSPETLTSQLHVNMKDPFFKKSGFVFFFLFICLEKGLSSFFYFPFSPRASEVPKLLTPPLYFSSSKLPHKYTSKVKKFTTWNLSPPCLALKHQPVPPSQSLCFSKCFFKGVLLSPLSLVKIVDVSLLLLIFPRCCWCQC